MSPRVTWEAAQRLRHLFRPHVIWGSVSTLQRSECQGVHRKSIRQPGLGNCGICHTGRCRSCRGELKSLPYATFLGFLNAQWDGQSGFPAGFCFPLDVLPLPNVVPLLVPLLWLPWCGQGSGGRLGLPFAFGLQVLDRLLVDSLIDFTSPEKEIQLDRRASLRSIPP